MERSPMVDGDPSTAKLMIIGMSPGEQELEEGMPFVGPTGHQLWKILDGGGIHRPDCYIVNTIGELPAGPKGKITDEQFSKYRTDFRNYVEKYKGRVVLILGGDGLTQYTGKTGIDSWRGYVIFRSSLPIDIELVDIEHGVYKTGPRKGQPKLIKKKKSWLCTALLPTNAYIIIPTLHPAGVMRTGKTTLPALVEDCQRACRAVRQPEEFTERVKENSLVEPVPEAVPLNAVAFDVEGYDFITESGLAFAGPMGLYAESRKWSAETYNWTQRILENPNFKKIAHNAPFDLEKLAQEGIEVKGELWDTMLMAAMAQPDMPKGLKYVASMYLDIERWDEMYDTDINKYNALDAKHTLRLFYKLHEILKANGQLELFQTVIMPCVPTLMEMSRIGLYVDSSRRAKWVKELEQKFSRASIDWMGMGGTPDWNKPLKIKAFLSSAPYYMDIQFNKYGKETVDETAIRTLILDYPEHKELLETLLVLRKTSKELSTYSAVPLSDEFTVHPSYLPASKDDDHYDEDGEAVGKGLAGTWRPTAKRPNIQNQTPGARNMFVPRIPGYKFVTFDFDSFEARILAALSDDNALKAAIEKDIHKHNSEGLGVDRVRAKNAFYGWSYGAGARTLRNTFKGKGYDIPERECRKLLVGLDLLYPKAARHRDRIISTAKHTHYVENPFGLRRYFWGDNPGTAPANTIIQSTAAMILWKTMPSLMAEAKRQNGYMVAMVHDEVCFELPENFDPKPFKAIMEQPFDCIAPGFYVPVTCKVGPSWGEVEKVA